MKIIVLTLGIVYTLFYTAKASIEFFSIYDLAVSNPQNIYPDLLGHGPTMSGTHRSGQGIIIKTDWTDQNGNVLLINYGSRDAVSVITIVKPTECEHTRFMMWAWVDSVVNPRCGLLCLNDFEWRLGCKDFDGDNYFGNVIRLDKNTVLTLALSFHSVDGDMAIRFLWKEGSKSPNQYTQRFSTINYGQFASRAKLSYGAYRGEVYYLAFLQGSFDISTFITYVGSTGPVNMTSSCSNCDSESSLSCSSTKLKAIHSRLREYYCSCGIGGAYDIAMKRCLEIITDCKIPCSAEGCVAGEANCVSKCPSSFVVKEVKGEYSTCECEEGDIPDVKSELCSDEESKFNKGWIIFAVVASVVAGVGVALLVIHK